MLPSDLNAEQFKGYPPEARKLVTDYVGALQRLPLSFVPSLLREVIDYDFRFPPERKAIEKELANLKSLSGEQQREWFQDLSRITHLAETREFGLGEFARSVCRTVVGASLGHASTGCLSQGSNRLCQPLAGGDSSGASGDRTSAWQSPSSGKAQLRTRNRSSANCAPHGGYFTHVNPENGLDTLLNTVAARAKAHPAPYAHWYIDGGQEAAYDPALTCVSYHALEPVRGALLRKMHGEIEKPGMGPETLRTRMAQMRPEELGLGKAGDAVLDRFQVKLLTEGSGTQIFSTTFAQWAARETLRRAQPLTLMVRFAPRQRQRPMNELLSATQPAVDLDPAGSLVDADMGSYYTYLNQQRLTGAERSSFLVWFEGHNEAVAIGPGMPRGTASSTPTDLKQLLTWIS